VTQLAEVVGMEGDVVLLNDIFRFLVDAEDIDGKLVGHYEGSPARPSFFDKLQYFGLDREWMRALEEVAK